MFIDKFENDKNVKICKMKMIFNYAQYDRKEETLYSM